MEVEVDVEGVGSWFLWMDGWLRGLGPRGLPPFFSSISLLRLPDVNKPEKIKYALKSRILVKGEEK